ncbi:phosphate ABC transporter substrate-binding protein [Spirulina major CS-329]|uniref:phosphate ABC transporter substrate-binding protein n=1 Tax=Spirulina TaxID=1154 RepID=UPI00232D3A7D|nr:MULTISPECIES: phosphate ABC transporter substrate-binding protein [Spirulina]MDB9493115.1 phosphate ABC transporter substrate-binding protein [Spirulina subsalsa CS-330]MDB9503296.1 phosphate ABC transporter substrate-binding protein [Spirulina major CS-329]
MTQKNETLPLILALLVTAGILGGGIWFFTQRTGSNLIPTPDTATNPNPADGAAPPTNGTASNSFPVPSEVPAGTQLWIDGSTSMAKINAALTNRFKTQFPSASTTIQAQGTSKGIESLIAGQIDLAASSRPLTAAEQNQDLQTVPVAPDQLAFVVSVDNPYRGGLTQAQIQGIYTGQITNWSQVGGPDQPIRALNRPAVSGTYATFKEMVLGGQEASGSNVVTMERDETTGMLQQLQMNGIGYATAAQVENQQTVRVVPINNFNPSDPAYPYQRTLYYVYKNPPNPAVTAFLGFLNTPEAQTALQSAL